MSITIENKDYYATDEAAQKAGYTIDYVGQLCRTGKVSCKRVSGHWFVARDEFLAHLDINGVIPQKENDASSAQGDQGVYKNTHMYHGKEYISASRATELTGYTQDYVGQLARSGEIIAHKFGRLWFVTQESLIGHQKQNNSENTTSEHLSIAKPSQNIRHDRQYGASVASATTQTFSNLNQDTTIIPIHTSNPAETILTPRQSTPDINFDVTYTSETEEPLLPVIGSSGTLGHQINHSIIPRTPATTGQKGSSDPIDTLDSSTTTTEVIVPLHDVRSASKPLETLTSRTISDTRDSVILNNENKSFVVEHKIVVSNRRQPVQKLTSPLRKIIMYIILLTVIGGIGYIMVMPKITLLQHKQQSTQSIFSQKIWSTLEAYSLLIPGTEYTYTAE